MTPNLYRSTLLQHALKLFGFLVGVLLVCPRIMLSQNHDSGWSNPILIYGSDFGQIFQAYHKTGNQYMLLALTSQKSRIKYSDSTILNYYSKMQFSYSIKLKAHKKVDDCYYLTYKATYMATEHIMLMVVTIEQDTARLVLPENFLEQTYFLFK